MVKRPAQLSSEDEDDQDRRSSTASSSKRAKTNGHANGNGQEHSADEKEDDVEMKVEPEDELTDGEREELEREIDHDGGPREQGTIAQMGIVTRVVLDNFMCHNYLEVDFGPQINFLTGRNGSGKSAILTGITVALGAKATNTGRGTAMKAFINDYQDTARVTVHIKNKGPEAYRHDDYGDEIVVQRSLHRTGNASSYKIQSTKLGRRDKDRKTVSTKRDELDKILDHMNIQVDNPINVLSQDSARAFLTKSGAKEKYDFFLRGTSLAQLSEEYDLVKQNIDSINAALKVKSDSLPDMRLRVEEAQKRVDSVQVGAQLERKLLKVQAESAWSMVIGKEAQRDAKAVDLQEKKKRARKTQAKLDKATDEEKIFAAELTALEADANEVKEALQPAQEELNAAIKDLKEAKVDLRGADAEQKEMKDAIVALKREIAGYEAEIAKESARQAVDHSAEKQERQSEIERLTEVVNKAEAQAPILQEQLTRRRADKDEVQNRLDELLRRSEAHDQLMMNTSGRKNQLEQSRGGGPLAPYGVRLEELMSVIGRTRWQGEAPIGPLGVGVKLKQMKYENVIHTQLGSLLSSFAVTTPADARQLRTLFRECTGRGTRFHGGQQPGIIIYRPNARLDYSSGDMSRHGYMTLLSLLEIPNVHVRNLLVDRASVERTPVFDTREEASNEVVKLGEGATTVSLQPCYKMTIKGGTLSSNFASMWKNPGLFVKDHEAEIRAITEEIRLLRLKKEDLLAERRLLQDQERDIVQDVRKMLQHLDSQHNETGRHKSAISTLKEQNRDQDPPNIGAFHDLITEKGEEVRNLEAQLRDSEAATARMTADAGPLAARHADIVNRMKADKAKYKALEEEMVIKAQEVVKKKNDVQHWDKATEPAEVAVAQAESDLQTLEDELADWTTSCQGVHPDRVETNRTKEKLDADIRSIEKSIREQKRDAGISLEDATEQMERAAAAYRAAKKEIQEMKALNLSLTAALTLRGAKWHEFRRYIALRAKVLFTKNLSVRGFIGKLIFKHDLGTLDLKVQTDEHAGTGTQGEKNPNQLSGGEKSFSTVALLLSFWDAVGCPIRCLDEFDVFMDAVVRRQTLTMMINTAKATDNTQFILISPQDMSGVITGPSVKIIQMHDPKRYSRRDDD